MVPAPFDYVAPGTLDEAIQALASYGADAKLLSGGHSLVPLMKLRLVRPKVIIDLAKIRELNGIRVERERIQIGALTTHYELETSPVLRQKCALLSQTAATIGDAQVRNYGTIGGSLAHADPGADLPAAILALGAKLRLVGVEGERWVEAEDFFLDVMSTVLGPTEILATIEVPVLEQGCGVSYQKVPQKASGFAIIGVAVWLRLGRGEVLEDMGLGISGLGAKPIRAKTVETRLKGRKVSPAIIEEASQHASDGADPLDDIYGSGEFRRYLARVYAAKGMLAALRAA